MMIVTICPTGEQNTSIYFKMSDSNFYFLDITVEETLFTLQLATRVRKITTSGHIQKNSNAKNLEAEIRRLKLELKDSNKKKMLLGGALLEAKKEVKKAQEKVPLPAVQPVAASIPQQQHQIQIMEVRLKATEEARKATEAVMQQQKRQLAELTAKLKEEKDAREQTSMDLELTQRSLKKTIAQARKVTAEYSKQVKPQSQISGEGETNDNAVVVLEDVFDALHNSMEDDLVWMNSSPQRSQSTASSKKKPVGDATLETNRVSGTMPMPSFFPSDAIRAKQPSTSSMPPPALPNKSTVTSPPSHRPGTPSSEIVRGQTSHHSQSDEHPQSQNSRPVSATRPQRGSSSFGFSPNTTSSSRPSSRGTVSSVRSMSTGSVRSLTSSVAPPSGIPRNSNSSQSNATNSSINKVKTASSALAAAAAFTAQTVSGLLSRTTPTSPAVSVPFVGRNSGGNIGTSVGGSGGGTRSVRSLSFNGMRKPNKNFDAVDENDNSSIYSGSNMSNNNSNNGNVPSAASLNSLSTRVSSVTQRTEMALKKHQVRLI